MQPGATHAAARGRLRATRWTLGQDATWNALASQDPDKANSGATPAAIQAMGQFTKFGKQAAGSPATCSKDLVKLHLRIRNHLEEIF